MSQGAAVPGTNVPASAQISPGGPQGVLGAGGATGAAGDAEVGSIKAWPSVTPPASWLLVDGSAVSRTLYPALFALIGTAYGAGDGSTTFNLPDMRGRFICGQGGGTGLTNRVLAVTGGEENHALSIAELASHTHTDSGHTHPQTYYGATASLAQAAGNIWYGTANTPTGVGVANIQPTGSGIGHNTMPPFLVLVYIIKAAPSGGATAQAPIADSTQSGLLRQVSGNTTDYVGGDNTCHALPQPGASAGFISKAAAYTLLSTDSGKYILCTGNAWTLTLPIAAVNLLYRIRNDQGLVANGTITLQPQTGSKIDGLNSINLLPSQECTILSDGTNWRTFELKREVVLGTQDITSAVANGVILLPLGFRQFDLEWTGMLASTGGPCALYGLFSTDGGNTWLTTVNYYWEYFFTSGATTVSGGTGAAQPQAYMGYGIDAGPRGHVKTTLCPGGLNRNPSWHSESAGYSPAIGVGARMTISGFYSPGTVPINALQYYLSTGNINQSSLTVKGNV